MQALTGYHHQLVELSTELVNHGFGEMTIRVVSPKGNSTARIEISCGKTYLFIVEKESKLDKMY